LIWWKVSIRRKVDIRERSIFHISIILILGILMIFMSFTANPGSREKLKINSLEQQAWTKSLIQCSPKEWNCISYQYAQKAIMQNNVQLCEDMKTRWFGGHPYALCVWNFVWSDSWKKYCAEYTKYGWNSYQDDIRVARCLNNDRQ
jgi:hypothetical protein